MRTEIYLLRHGETGLNRKRVYFGHLDTSMTDLGRESIRHVSESFYGSLDVVICSDLDRCQESASIFTKEKNIKRVLDDRLRELDFGVFEGRSYQDLVAEFPDESKAFFSGDHEFMIPAGESIGMLFERTTELFEEVVETYKGKSILLSTHGGPIRAILSRYLAGDEKAYWKFAVDHASLTKLVYEDGFVYLEYMGRGSKIKPIETRAFDKKGA